MTAAQAYAAAVDALQAARRARKDALRHCENYDPGDEADYRTNYPGSPSYPACFWDEDRARADWCEACAARTDLGDWKALKRAKARAQAEVLRAGRQPGAPEGDSITRTSIALVEARDEVKRLTAERAACTCEFEPREVLIGGWLQDVDPLRVRAPFDEEDRITIHKRRLPAKTAPCWQYVTVRDEDGETGAIGDWSADGWCEPCERRQLLHEQLRAARRRVVALTSGHLAATKAHMRRIGRLPPLVKPTPPAKIEPTKPPPAPREEDPDDDLPF